MVALMATFAPTIAELERLTTVRLPTLSNRNVDVAADANGSVETDKKRGKAKRTQRSSLFDASA